MIGLGGAPQRWRRCRIRRSGRADQPAFGFIALCIRILARWDFQPTTYDNFSYTITGVRRDWAQKNKALTCGSYAPILKPASFSTTPKNKEAAVRALAERTKAEKEEAEKPMRCT